MDRKPYFIGDILQKRRNRDSELALRVVGESECVDEPVGLVGVDLGLLLALALGGGRVHIDINLISALTLKRRVVHGILSLSRPTRRLHEPLSQTLTLKLILLSSNLLLSGLAVLHRLLLSILELILAHLSLGA
jgi:hypothetical protein